jgi:hypothetical protein
MKLGLLVLQLRNTTELFQNRVGGSAEFAFAQGHTLSKEMAFVLPSQEAADPNQYDSDINQKLTEQFSVVVAIKNDTNHKDKTGFIAYNRLHDIRKDLFQAFLGLDASEILDDDDGFTTESLIYYRGGQLLDFDRAYLWYQFTFEYKVGLTSQVKQPNLPWFNRIFAQYAVAPDAINLPIDEALPVDSFDPEMEQLIDFSVLGAARGWILEGGFWDDLGEWQDLDDWID